jgi:hypothetical protein
VHISTKNLCINKHLFSASMNAPITLPLHLVVIIIGCFLSLTLGFFLLFNKKNKANPFLGVLIFVISTYFITGFFDRFDFFVHTPHIIGIGTVTPFLMGPLSYLIFMYVPARKKNLKCTVCHGCIFYHLSLMSSFSCRFF